MKVVNSDHWIAMEAMRMFMDKYDIPEPTEDKGSFYSWDFRTEEEKNSPLAPYVSIFNDPSVSIACWGGKWGMGTSNIEKGGVLRHMDFWGFYSTDEEAIKGIFGALEDWAKVYWLKRK